MQTAAGCLMMLYHPASCASAAATMQCARLHRYLLHSAAASNKCKQSLHFTGTHIYTTAALLALAFQLHSRHSRSESTQRALAHHHKPHTAAVKRHGTLQRRYFAACRISKGLEVAELWCKAADADVSNLNLPATWCSSRDSVLQAMQQQRKADCSSGQVRPTQCVVDPRKACCFRSMPCCALQLDWGAAAVRRHCEG